MEQNIDPDVDVDSNTKTTLLNVKKQNKRKSIRYFVGIGSLLLVDVIWVASSELTKYLFQDVNFNKPYMSTYIKTSMFSIYLLGFVVYGPWRRKCIRCACDDYPGQYQLVGETDTEDTDDTDYALKNSLSESIYVPAKIPSASEMESSDSERRTKSPVPRTRVKFNNLMEVKHLEDTEDAQIARMNYGAALRTKFLNRANKGKLTLPQVIRISFFFSLIFFLGNLAYQEALSVKDVEVALVNILSSTSGMITLILAALFPSGPGDKFSFSKLIAVLVSFAGIVMVTLGDMKSDVSSLTFSNAITTGAMWSLLGAFCYAIYVVFIKKAAGEEGQIDPPMFFGFVGLFCCSILWPGMVALHYLNFEEFELPSRLPAILLTANGLVGTVLSELLWLWGCLATSSLVGVMSLSLTIPLSIIVDILFRKVTYSWLFYAGVGPVFISFVAVAYLSHKNPSNDPLLSCLKKCCCCCCKKKKTELEKEQEIPLTLLSADASSKNT